VPTPSRGGHGIGDGTLPVPGGSSAEDLQRSTTPQPSVPVLGDHLGDVHNDVPHSRQAHKKALRRTASRLLRASAHSPEALTRDLGRFVGQVVSTTRAIRPAKRRLLHVQHALGKGVRAGGWHGHSKLSTAARSALGWWTTTAVTAANGNDILPPLRPIQIRMRTDAATNNAGYGGVMWCGNKVFRTQGYLTKQEQTALSEPIASSIRGTNWGLSTHVPFRF
jgi:hypothetical protein